ncbi:1,4-dihydroxy-2-naphthoate polyprenyltransferase [Aestuariimicrobium kwangyangense]|uniref:1,4-dihydroxy-2-naphthoate polyprenyltransferase n=1 Tax=Aestuariimicrobium kwangyangense TaxID=396389 RepID=UPI0003B51661|nr:1,4-dihydroxy-2-naphthoate polyprenyltransferase [Aestuariimicrobium kwangyangense]
MATFSQWVEGARPRTLPAATAPVMAGTATALFSLDRGSFGGREWLVVLLCFVVALALQVGVNYANDYSDGVRGTDDDRVGPMRLVGSRAARAREVKAAAFACFGVGALAGLGLVLVTHHWWLVAVGVACILAAWFYTGGSHPYGYAGLGELMVFIFFGLVAVGGTHYLLTGTIDAAAVIAAVAIGALACALLVANNLRDIVGDREVGKRTLATRLGDASTRRFYLLLAVVAALGCVAVSVLTSVWLLAGLVCLVGLVPALRRVRGGALGRDLIPVLKFTGQAELLLGIGLVLGAVLARW